MLSLIERAFFRRSRSWGLLALLCPWITPLPLQEPYRCSVEEARAQVRSWGITAMVAQCVLFGVNMVQMHEVWSMVQAA